MNNIVKATISFCIISLSACSISVDTEIAELAAEEFHKSYNAGSYENIYINAEPSFKDYISKKKFIFLLKKVNERIGIYKSSSLIQSSSVKSTQNDTVIMLVYKADYQFDQNVKVYFQYKVVDDRAMLANFNISSKNMKGTGNQI